MNLKIRKVGDVIVGANYSTIITLIQYNGLLPKQDKQTRKPLTYNVPNLYE